MNCPRCGARNPREAAWCTQCFDAFDTATDVDHLDRVDRPGHVDRLDEVDEVDEADAVGTARSGDVRVTGEHVEWHCRRCDGWNDFERAGCVVCGAPREGFGSGPASAGVRVPIATARLASALLPGLGHILMGAVGSGVARAGLFVVWVAGGIALVGDATWGGLVLILGALVLWTASLVDVRRLTSGQRELLGSRGLGALVVAVTLLLVLGVALRLAGG